MSTDVPSLGWLGTGRMGAALAGRLIDAREHVTVWNRTKAKVAPLVANGARAADRIADLGDCDIVFITVSAPADLTLEVPMPVAAAVRQLIQSAIDTGLRDKDFLSLYDQQARNAGLVREPS